MTSIPPTLLDLVSQVISGQATDQELIEAIRRAAPPGPVGQPDEIDRIAGATVDLGRKARCGFSEVIFGEGKTAELVADIIRSQLGAHQGSLVTRIDAEVAFQVRQRFDHAVHNPQARTLRVSGEPMTGPRVLTSSECASTIHVAVVTAGSTDAPVAEEACETLAWMGVPLQRFDDVGVAGPQRLLSILPRLREASAVIVVAGMEGALPAVVAGHLAVPVFAVPTSVGYGASLGGLTALMGMLSSCAANVAVVNIDAGFKAGYLAGLLIGQLNDQRGQRAALSAARSEAT